MTPQNIKIKLVGINADVPLQIGAEYGYRNALELEKVTIVENATEADAIICIDVDVNNLNFLDSDKLKVLIRNEPKVVLPANYDKEIVEKFDLKIDVGKFSKNLGQFTAWPQLWQQFDQNTFDSFQRSNRVVLINGNKLSFIGGELYSLRRQAIFHFPEIDLFGTNWDIKFVKKNFLVLAELHKAIKFGSMPRMEHLKHFFKTPKNYFGTTNSKYEVLKKYKYSLVIENSLDYMTEKLFDSFFAGCLPIYVGPNVELFDVPADLVIQSKPTLTDIKYSIETARNIDFENWQSNLYSWLNDPHTVGTWSAANAYRKIVNQILNKIIDNKN